MLQYKEINKRFTVDGFYTAFDFEWENNYIFEGESHDFWEIVFVRSGEVEVTEDENVYTLGAGDMIFHAPMEFHRIKSSGGTCPSGFITSFCASGEIPEAVRRGVISPDDELINFYERFTKKASLFIRDESAAELGFESAALLAAFIANIGYREAANEFDFQKSASLAASAFEYRKIVSFMFRNVCQNLSLDDISKQNNISVSYLKLLFNTYAGISPKKYFNNLRLRHATRLLSDGKTITDVSDTMNFSSPNYFSYFYKKNTGRAPSEHKKSI